MRKFLLHIFICLATILLLNVAYLLVVDGSLRKYQRQYFSFRKNANRLILGDSHAARAWVANSDRGLYNFAYGSDNITDMLSKFEYASNHTTNATQKTVILPFDGYLVSAYREKMHNNLINNVINSPYVNSNIVYSFPLLFDRNTSLDTKQFILGLFRNRNAKEFDDKTSTKTPNKSEMRGRFNFQFPSGQKSLILLSQYQRVIDRVRESGYDIIALRYPLHPYYDSLVKNSPFSIQLTSVMDSLASANDLEIVDFSLYISEGKYFRDQDHLNEEGSKHFIRTFDSLFHTNSN